jgi:hypothetical protein
MASQSDTTILKHIEDLVGEEQRLYQRGDLSGEDQVRLDKLQVELDQCWDLLRQRRALREFGKDPDQAHTRPPDMVEKYEQ